MTDEQHIHELIDQYLMGELVGQDLDKFKIRLKDDPAFLKQVQLQKAIIQSIEASRHADLKAMLQERTSKSRGIIPLNGRLLAIAATVVSLVALGFVLRYVIGFGPENSELSTEDKPPAVQEQVAKPDAQEQDADDLVLVDSLKNEDKKPLPITEIDSNAQYVVADEEPVDEEIEEPRYFNVETDEDADLAQLREDEEELDGERFKARRDTMLGSTNVVLWAVNTASVVRQSDITSVTTNDDTDKKASRGLGRKNKDKKQKEELDKESVPDELKAPAKPIRQQVKSVRVEFWHSIVNFKGYKFDGNKLLLFDTPQNTSLSLTQLDGNIYLNKNGTYYRIIANNSFNQLRKVTDSTVLNSLNQK